MARSFILDPVRYASATSFCSSAVRRRCRARRGDGRAGCSASTAALSNRGSTFRSLEKSPVRTIGVVEPTRRPSSSTTVSGSVRGLRRCSGGWTRRSDRLAVWTLLRHVITWPAGAADRATDRAQYRCKSQYAQQLLAGNITLTCATNRRSRTSRSALCYASRFPIFTGRVNYGVRSSY